MRLWIRTNGGNGIGMGHVMRMTALAEVAIAAGTDVRFVVDDGRLAARLSNCHGVLATTEDGPDGQWLRRVDASDVVVFDGYQFGNDDYLQVKDLGARVACVEDRGIGDHAVDIVVNPNTSDVAYVTSASTRVLAGPAYALVRRRFREFRRIRGERCHTLVVTLGGSDVADVGLTLLETLKLQGLNLHVMFVVGPFMTVPTSRSSREVPVSYVVDPPDIATTFDKADIAISAAGVTAWELLCMGMPSMFLEVADNQQAVCRTLAQAEVGLVLGSPRHVEERLPAALARMGDANQRRALSERALALIDGLGPARVLEELWA